MAKPFFFASLLLLVLLFSGCQSPGAFVRNDPSVPFRALRLYYGDPGTVRKLVEMQDDFAQRFRGTRRVGEGILSVGVMDGRGRWVESYECGGHLFVTGTAGEPCQIVLRNESKNRLEIVAGMDGRDVVSGGVFTLDNQGVILRPSQTVVLGKVTRNKPATLRFGPGRSPSAGPVVEMAVTPSEGSILLAVFHEKGRFPWERGAFLVRKSVPTEHPQPQGSTGPMKYDHR